MADYRDPADSSAESHVQAAIERQTKTREAQNEIDKMWRLKGGRNNPDAFVAKGSGSSDPLHKEMAAHSANFIDAVRRKDRGAANAARMAFHVTKSASRNTPKGMEQPCPSGNCSRTNVAPNTCEKTGGCRPMEGTSTPKVGRPRG